MGILRKPIVVWALLIVGFVLVLHREASPQDAGRKGQGPPPEAYVACEGKSAGAKAELTGPQGETITGICEQEGDRMVLRPDRPLRVQ